MKNKTSLVLMEQLVMVLVFALAAAICIQIFVRADQRSRQITLRDRAVVLAQNGAEAVKAANGSLETAADILGGNVTDGTLTLQAEDILLEITTLSSDVPGLGKALVAVTAADDALLFSLTTGWQEVAP